MLNIDGTTVIMIDDIVDSFESVLSGNSNSNILSGIIETSQRISNKYMNQINDGTIELDKIMETIFKKIPGIEQLISTLVKPKSTNTNNNKVLIDSTFSTANVEVGNSNANNLDMNLGTMLKLADNLGVIPDNKNKKKYKKNKKNKGELNDNILNNLFTDLAKNLTDKSDGIPSNQLDNMINMIKKIDNSKSQTDIKKIQNQMDTFLKNNFNINLDNFKDLK